MYQFYQHNNNTSTPGKLVVHICSIVDTFANICSAINTAADMLLFHQCACHARSVVCSPACSFFLFHVCAFPVQEAFLLFFFLSLSVLFVEVGVHIADVSHFIRPGTALDVEAGSRGTTVYLIDRVSWMCVHIRTSTHKHTHTCARTHACSHAHTYTHNITDTSVGEMCAT